MRLQLTRFLWVLTLVLLAWPAEAQIVHIDTTHTFFFEAPTRTNMFVYTPAVDGRASPWEWLDIKAGWEADLVSGASVSVKAGPAYKATQPAADVVSTASVTDFRNVVNGGFSIKNVVDSAAALRRSSSSSAPVRKM